jgi:hypothetical protein
MTGRLFVYPTVREIVAPRPSEPTVRPGGPRSQRDLVVASLLRRPADARR